MATYKNIYHKNQVSFNYHSVDHATTTSLWQKYRSFVDALKPNAVAW